MQHIHVKVLVDKPNTENPFDGMSFGARLEKGGGVVQSSRLAGKKMQAETNVRLQEEQEHKAMSEKDVAEKKSPKKTRNVEPAWTVENEKLLLHSAEVNTKDGPKGITIVWKEVNKFISQCITYI